MATSMVLIGTKKVMLRWILLLKHLSRSILKIVLIFFKIQPVVDKENIFNELLQAESIVIKGVFKTLSDIYDGAY